MATCGRFVTCTSQKKIEKGALLLNNRLGVHCRRITGRQGFDKGRVTVIGEVTNGFVIQMTGRRAKVRRIAKLGTERK